METIKELKIGNITAKELADQHYNYWLRLTRLYSGEKVNGIKIFKDEIMYYNTAQQKEVCVLKNIIKNMNETTEEVELGSFLGYKMVLKDVPREKSAYVENLAREHMDKLNNKDFNKTFKSN